MQECCLEKQDKAWCGYMSIYVIYVNESIYVISSLLVEFPERIGHERCSSDSRRQGSVISQVATSYICQMFPLRNGELKITILSEAGQE